MKRSLILLTLASLATSPTSAEIAATRWTENGARDSDYHAYGIDLDTGLAVWDFPRKATVNFVQLVPGDRVLVGADDGTLALLDAKTGKPEWDVSIGEHRWEHVNTFHGSFEMGYLVSDNREFMWFIGLDGKILWERFGKPKKDTPGVAHVPTKPPREPPLASNPPPRPISWFGK